MKKILGLTIAALLVMALVGGGTWAYFSDVETSSDNTFTAGTLNLTNTITGTGAKSTTTEQADGLNDKVVFANLAPGDSGTITWVLENTGSIAGTLNIDSTVTFADVDDNEPELAVTDPHASDGGSNGDIDEFVGVKLQRGVGADETAAITAFTYIVGTADDFIAFSQLNATLTAESQALAALGGNDTIVYRLSIEVEADITDPGANYLFGDGADDGTADDNIIQSDSADLDITFTLDQTP